MKKYDLSSIMKAAWTIRRTTGKTMSESLKASWAAAKAGTSSAITGTPREIKTIYREARGYCRGYFGDEVLEAIEDGKGNITLQYAQGGEYTKNAKTNRTNYVTFTLAAGALNGELFGIDLTAAKSFSGQTYSVRTALKAAGYRWNGQAKTWTRA